ncbi:redoxin domain-containing protein [Rasiella rasia]|uniref:Redoxin domain-containing protein n=1 Tax=Rasiella rasia TaxID=2744027 RepID=A0A6G6GQA3_9FLAO|nr:redoxin domain-containing protein [Rasiella rasia]QIE60766.1 redoxin domain-containing protein [Rasiella rasia]
MSRKLLLLTFLISFSAFSQDTLNAPVTSKDTLVKPMFSQEITKNINKYVKQSQLAYHDQDYVRADFLYDSLVTHVILNTYLDNFKVKKRSGKQIEFNDFKKPMILLSTASWCTPGSGTIPALNEIAHTYGKNIDFVVLYWDTKKNARKASKDFSSNIQVIYVDELENKSVDIVKDMKHTLGLPTCYLLDENKKIIDIRRTVIHPYHTDYQTSFDDNYTAFYAGVQLLHRTVTIETSLEVIGVDKN